MRCPFCGQQEDKVVDSRTSKEGASIRRRRECLGCGKRFTTYETVEAILPMVVKKDGRREPFDRQKVLAGLKKACEKRPISVETLEAIASEVEQALQERADKEVPSAWIGGEIMKRLHALDPVAYVRFASVYREFKDVSAFVDELKVFLGEKRKE